MANARVNQQEARLVSISQAEVLLGISRSTLYRLIRGGNLSVVRINRCVRISMAEIERFISELGGENDS